YLVFRAAGLGGVVLFKAATIALAFWVLFKDATLPREPVSDRALRAVVAAGVLLGCLPMIRHRFVERPDIALMVFLAFTIYALNAYLGAGRRWIVLLPAVYVVWANVQPSIIVSVVPFLAVLGGGVALRLAARVVPRWVASAAIPSWRQLTTVAVVLAGVMLASLVNPYGLDVHTLPFKLAEQAWLRQAVGQLQAVRPSIWLAPFVLAGVLLPSLLATVTRLPLVPALPTVPLAVLGLSAV